MLWEKSRVGGRHEGGTERHRLETECLRRFTCTERDKGPETRQENKERIHEGQ